MELAAQWDVGAQQESVLSPFLFTLYILDFEYKSESAHLQTFSAVVGVYQWWTGGEQGTGE